MRRAALALAGLLAGCGLQLGADPTGAGPDGQGPAPTTLTADRAALDFGVVAVAETRTQVVTVDNPTEDTLAAAPRIVGDARSTFTVTAPVRLAEGLDPGSAVGLEVTYRPCPEAFAGGALDPSFDTSSCPLTDDAATLVIAEDVQVRLTGGGGRAPRAALLCPPPSPDGCPDPAAEPEPCGAIDFGVVGLGAECRIPLTLVNARRGPERGADLVVTSARLRVLDAETREVFDGRAAGLELEVTPSAMAPLRLPLEDGAPTSARRLWVRADGLRQARLRGEAARGAGLRLATNDPDTPELLADLSVAVEAPEVTLFPSDAPVEILPEVGHTDVVDFTVQNHGPGRARIAAVYVEASSEEIFVIEPPAPEPIEAGGFARFGVAYRRARARRAEAVVQVKLHAPLSDLYASINASPGPTCEIAPRRLDLSAGLPRGVITVRAPGERPCRIRALDLEPRGASDLEDFAVDLPECRSLPCELEVDLCPAALPACEGAGFEIPIIYRNPDVSLSDAAELVVTNLDGPPLTADVVGTDPSCLPPTPVIEVLTEAPCVGQPVHVSAAASAPGGPPGRETVIDNWFWAYSFTQAGPPGPLDTPELTFTPAGPGAFVLELTVSNDCGAISEGHAAEVIVVPEQCP